MISVKRVGFGSYGTLGVMFLNAWPFCLTLEPKNPIPAGTYPLTKYLRPNGDTVYLLHDVPGFTYIEIHPGNTLSDTSGCIMPGLYMGFINGVFAVLGSKLAFNKIMAQNHEQISIS
jgi:hypothetical protein